MSKKVEIVVVRGAEGPSLQVWGENGGKRIAGPKAWGNPYNKPLCRFVVDAEEMIAAVQEFAADDAPRGEGRKG